MIHCNETFKISWLVDVPIEQCSTAARPIPNYTDNRHLKQKPKNDKNDYRVT